MQTSHPIATRRRESLTEQVLRDLQQRIEGGEIKPGEKLPSEHALMSRYAVSRTVVREAISSLRAAGQIATQQGRGAFVLEAPAMLRFKIDDSERTTLFDVALVMDLRIGLESEAAAVAAERRTPAAMEVLEQAWQALEAGLLRQEPALEQDRAFHLAVAAATGNPYFLDLLEQIAPTMLPRARVDLFKDDHSGWHDYLAGLRLEHQAIYQAIAQGDPQAARAAMHRHLSHSRGRLRASLEPV